MASLTMSRFRLVPSGILKNGLYSWMDTRCPKQFQNVLFHCIKRQEFIPQLTVST